MPKSLSVLISLQVDPAMCAQPPKFDERFQIAWLTGRGEDGLSSVALYIGSY
jgi:hypothetical protein